MKHYEQLTEAERQCVEQTLDDLTAALRFEGMNLAGDDRAARAAEALARWIVESR
jgi:hypothetical protein